MYELYMKILKTSDILLDKTLKKLGRCYKNYDKNSRIQLDRYLLHFYKNIRAGERYVASLTNIKKTLVEIISIYDMPKPMLWNSEFLPKEIRLFIKENSVIRLTYKSLINNKYITLHFFIYSNITENNIEMYDNYARLVFIWVYILSLYSFKKCSKYLDIYIFLTPFKKNLPNSKITTLDISHVNTAFTTAGCNNKGEIVIFREEEWFKVLIHETFHNFGLDFSTMNTDKLKKKVKDIFPIASEFQLTETYCETWARIINCMFSAYELLDDKKDWESYLSYSNLFLQIERVFSISQCNKILKFMDISYSDLYDGLDSWQKSQYREKSNVFCYYILTSILMNDYLNFLDWCNKNNMGFLRFTNSMKNLENFGVLIEEEYDTESFLGALDCIKIINSMSNSTRMSVLEL